MDLFSKITGKRNYSSSFSSSSSSPSESKTDFNQIQNTNHFSSSSINADNSIYNSHNSKSPSHQVNTNTNNNSNNNNKKYQSSNSNVKENSFKNSNNNITPNDGHFDENNSNDSTSTFYFISQVLPSNIACCWKLIAAIFTLVFVTIIIISCFKICHNYLCCCCCSCLNCCSNKRPPSPVPMTVSSITASHSLLEANSWEK